METSTQQPEEHYVLPGALAPSANILFDEPDKLERACRGLGFTPFAIFMGGEKHIPWTSAIEFMERCAAEVDDLDAEVAKSMESLPQRMPLPWFMGAPPSYAVALQRLLGEAYRELFPCVNMRFEVHGRVIMAEIWVPKGAAYSDTLFEMGRLVAAHGPRLMGLESIHTVLSGTGPSRRLELHLPSESEERTIIDEAAQRHELGMTHPERETVVRQSSTFISSAEPAESEDEIWNEVAAGLWGFEDAFDHNSQRYLVAVRRSGKDAERAALSPREREVCVLLAQGESNKFIAFELEVTASTVSTWIRRIAKKLGLATRLELVAALRLLNPK